MTNMEQKRGTGVYVGTIWCECEKGLGSVTRKRALVTKVSPLLATHILMVDEPLEDN